jgi:hypothetical protein
MSAVQSSGSKADGHVSLNHKPQEVLVSDKNSQLGDGKDYSERLLAQNTLESEEVVSKKAKTQNIIGFNSAHLNNNFNEKQSAKGTQLLEVANIIDLVSQNRKLLIKNSQRLTKTSIF